MDGQGYVFEIGLSIQSEDPTHPKVPTGSDPKTGWPDQVTDRWRVICSKNRLWWVGLGFPLQNPKKPDPTDVLRISSKNFQNLAEISRFRRDFLDSSLKYPNSDFKFSDSSNKLSYFSDLSSRSSDISPKFNEISPDLARSHQIRLDLRRIWCFFAWNQLFWLDFSPWTVPTEPTVFPAQNQPCWFDSLAGRRWIRIFSTQFYRVGLWLGTNPTRTDPWTPLIRKTKTATTTRSVTSKPIAVTSLCALDRSYYGLHTIECSKILGMTFGLQTLLFFEFIFP